MWRIGVKFEVLVFYLEGFDTELDEVVLFLLSHWRENEIQVFNVGIWDGEVKGGDSVNIVVVNVSVNELTYHNAGTFIPDTLSHTIRGL